VFDDLDATLQAVLKDPAAPTDLHGADVSFETPDKDFTPTHPTVNLFLYEALENHSLRENAPIQQLVNGTYQQSAPPMRVDCTYLVTTWSTKTAGLKAQEEHRLLGQALMWLNQFPAIGASYLQGALATPPQPFPLPAMVAQLKEDQSSGQFWTALGTAPRPAFSLTVTIAMALPEPPQEFPAVQHVLLDLKQQGS
jgi:hypothetical protein